MNLLDKAVAYCLNIHTMGDHRKVDNKKVDLKEKDTGTTADEDSMSVAMKILKSDEYDEILSLDRAAKRDLEKLALPSPFKDGIYLIPIKLIDRVNNQVKEYKARREGAVEKFLVTYQNAIDDARQRLAAFFDASYYPSIEVVRSRFRVSDIFVEFSTPKALNDISSELMEQERQAMRAQMEEAAEEIRLALRSSFQQLVGHMVSALTPNPDGKYKKFFESTLTNMKEFLNTFSARNIIDDTELDGLVNKAQSILAGADVTKLRDGDSFKQMIATQMKEVKETLVTLVTCKSRKFDFSEAV